MASFVMTPDTTYTVWPKCAHCDSKELVGVHYMDAMKCKKCGTLYTISGLKAQQSWSFPKMTRAKAIALNNGA